MKLLGLVCLVSAAIACSTELEPSDAGRRVSGVLTYGASSTIVDTYEQPLLFLVVQEYVADPETGQPTQQTSSNPAGAIFHLLLDSEIAQLRGAGYSYEISNIGLQPAGGGEELSSWSYSVSAAITDLVGFTFDATSIFLAAPSGAYPNICAANIAYELLTDSDKPRIEAALESAKQGEGTEANVDAVIAAVNSRLPALLVQAFGQSTVTIQKDVPTTGIDMEINDNAGDPTNQAIPCKVELAQIIQQQIDVAVQNLITTGSA